MRDFGFSEGLAFMKMHGLGNDFVVVDARKHAVSMTPKIAHLIGDRRKGIGFDQLVIINPSDDVAAELVFYNSDGSTSGACGNATRCIARHIMQETGLHALSLRTERGVLNCVDAQDGKTSVNMLAPQLTWQEVPLAEDVDLLHLPIPGDPVATGMGNPHCTFFVEDAEAIELEFRGSEIEHHPLFPERTNVQFVSILGENHLRMRVWERGAGVTLASGSSSCAVATAAHRRGLTGRKVLISLDGGDLEIEWKDDGVWMTGETCHVSNGVLTSEFLSQA